MIAFSKSIYNLLSGEQLNTLIQRMMGREERETLEETHKRTGSSSIPSRLLTLSPKMVPLEYHPRPPLKSSLVKTHHVPTTFYRPLRTFKNPWPSDLPPSKVFPHAFWRPDPDHEDDLIDEVRGLKEDVDRDKEGVEFPVKCLRWDQSPTTRNNKWAKKAEGKVRSCWLGHAGVLVMIPLDSENGEEVGVLFDPVFEDRCSPSGNFGPIRDIQSPCAVEDLPVSTLPFFSTHGTLILFYCCL